MKTSVYRKWKCRECGFVWNTDVEHYHGFCFKCSAIGTLAPEEPEQPTAIAGTATARRIGEADSEAVVDGPAPLCDGPVKLRAHLAVCQREVRRALRLARGESFSPQAELDYLEINAALAEVGQMVKAVTPIGPAQSAELR